MASTAALRQRASPAKAPSPRADAGAKAPAPVAVPTALLALAALALALTAVASGAAGRGVPFLGTAAPRNADLLAVMGGSWAKVRVCARGGGRERKREAPVQWRWRSCCFLFRHAARGGGAGLFPANWPREGVS
jgi:hypothetical protein